MKKALTLVEVMISMGIFAMLAGGIFASAIYVRKMSERNVRESIALAVANGFVEQLIAADFPIITQHINDRTRAFPFVSRNGEDLLPPRTLVTHQETDWGNPILVPLVDRRDDAGNPLLGPAMQFWFIPAVAPSADTPADSVDIRVRFRWDDGQSGNSGAFRERVLYMIKTRVPT